MARLNLTKKKQDYVVERATPEGEKRREIRIVDWERIKKRIKDVPQESALDNFLNNAPWVSFSIAATSGLTLIFLDKGKSLIYSLYVCVAIFGFILGLILFFVNKQKTKEKKDYLTFIEEDMNEVEKTFISEEQEEKEPEEKMGERIEEEEIDVKDIPF